MEIRFDGRVAVVTGAGNGLGRAHALELARRGAKVVVNDTGGAVDGTGRSTDAAECVVEEIEAGGGVAIADHSSVADDDEVKALAERVLKTFGRVDIVVNNAGILRDKSFAKMEVGDFELVVNVHLLGAVRVTRVFWSAMKAQQYGRIVLTTSAAGLYGNFGQANYAAAKLGLVGLMNVLKIEGRKDNIRVNVIGPIAATRMTGNLAESPRGQAIKTEYVSPGVVVLVSDDAPTGMILCAGGGAFSSFRMMETRGAFVAREGLTAEMVRDALPSIVEEDELLSFTQATDHAQRLTEWAD